MGFQQLIKAIFPTQCANCADLVEEANSFCGTCWSDIPIIDGVVCNSCGRPVHGDEASDAILCDDCADYPRLWRNGRSVFIYSGLGRKLVLAFKHGDRTDLATTFAKIMAERAKEISSPETVVANIPAHWRRRLTRKYDQAELLAEAVAYAVGLEFRPGLIQRVRSTKAQEEMTVQERWENVADAFSVPASKCEKLKGKHVLLVDDVMTSGATLSEATKVLLDAGARQVSILALARVAKEI